jgi:tripartite-type tricarboxylate transporter receptor subunit TctC
LSQQFRRALAPLVLALALSGGTAGSAVAQAYPTKPVRVVVPYPAGGPVDILGRLIAQRLTESFGQPFVVDNRAGASGNIGSEFVAKSAPDGYTLVVGNNATHATNESLYPNLPYATLRDFAPIALVATVTNIVVVYPSLPVTSIPGLIAYAKANPGKLNYASSGSGSAAHLTGEMFKIATGTDIVHVPYRGAAPATTDLMAGQVGLMFATAPSVLQQVQAGTLRAIAVTSAARVPSLPNLPTVAESGLPDFSSDVWFGFLAPAGTPVEIMGKLNAELLKAATAADIREKLAVQGFEIATSTPEQFAAYIRVEVAKWAKIIKESGAKVD